MADRSSIPGIRRLLRAEFARVGVDQSLCFDCLVAVTEACTNALRDELRYEGADLDPEVGWEISPELGRFHVTDHSTRRWSMSSHPSRDLRAAGADDLEASIGTLGIDLIKNLMDDVEVTSGPEGTTVTLVKRFC